MNLEPKLFLFRCISILLSFQSLLKIIITQRETIQQQLQNLKAKDFYLKTLDR